jgi:hypothetical protein
LSKRHLMTLAPSTISLSIYGPREIQILSNTGSIDLSALRAAILPRIAGKTMPAIVGDGTILYPLEICLDHAALSTYTEGGYYISNEVAEVIAIEVANDVDVIRNGSLLRLVSIISRTYLGDKPFTTFFMRINR